VTAGADQALDIGFHQQLQNALGYGTKKVAFAALLQELCQWQSILGHRGVLGWDEVSNSTLTANRGDHLSSTIAGSGKSTTETRGNYTTSEDATMRGRVKKPGRSRG
jgi:hypothetical protein